MNCVHCLQNGYHEINWFVLFNAIASCAVGAICTPLDPPVLLLDSNALWCVLLPWPWLQQQCSGYVLQSQMPSVKLIEVVVAHSNRCHSAGRRDRTPAASAQLVLSKASASEWPVRQLRCVLAPLVHSPELHCFPFLDHPSACRAAALHRSHSSLPLC